MFFFETSETTTRRGGGRLFPELHFKMRLLHIYALITVHIQYRVHVSGMGVVGPAYLLRCVFYVDTLPKKKKSI